MRQAGILAAAGLVALDNHIERLAEDHANARLLAEGLANLEGVSIDLDRVQTNMVLFELTDGRTSEKYLAALREKGVLGGGMGPTLVRLVTHNDVSQGDVLTALDRIAGLH